MTKVSKKNIVEIFKEAQKKLDRIKIPKMNGGMAFTPYGNIIFNDEGDVWGNKKAIKYFRRKLREYGKRKKSNK